MEKKLQTEIIKFLKELGFYVIKTKPGMGTPVGCPDIVALRGSNWVAIECKASATAPYGPGQKDTLSRLKSRNRYVYAVHPDIWPEIKAELLTHFF